MRVLAVTMRLLVTLTALACAVSVAGCGASSDTGGPSSAPSAASPSSAPSGSPSPSAPAMPEAAKQGTKAGAVAFVKYYVAAFNHAQATGDVAPLRSLGAKGCVSCRAVQRSIRKTYRAGGHSDGGELVVEGHEVHRSLDHQLEVDLTGHFESSKNFASAGAQPSRLKGGPVVASFYVRFVHGWEVTRWTRA